MAKDPLRILQISTFDRAGGAEKIAYALHCGYRLRGHQAFMAVGRKRTADAHVMEISAGRPGLAWEAFWERRRAGALRSGLRGLPRLSLWLSRIGPLPRQVRDDLGLERFDFPGSHRVLDLPGERMDIVHAHNLHGDYFDLRALPRIARRAPVVLTLHDAWLTTGHCAHSFACDRWQRGCGQCPDLAIPPAITRDATAFNWKRKRAVFSRMKVVVVTPSHWLMERVERSLIAPAIVESKVIPNGIDLSRFRPGDRQAARAALGLPLQASVFMFSATSVRTNPWKDFRSLREALKLYAEARPDREVLFLAVGDSAPAERFGRAELRFVPFVQDDKLADYYRAATAYVHAARADTFPNTVIEALACGTPVVATAVGGISEQVEDDVTGFLVPPSDAFGLAQRMMQIAEDSSLLSRMSAAAAAAAAARYDSERMIGDYLQIYERCIHRGK
jgi:glycosyltransferase involved in cell wall biosynthesis